MGGWISTETGRLVSSGPRNTSPSAAGSHRIDIYTHQASCPAHGKERGRPKAAPLPWLSLGYFAIRLTLSSMKVV